VSDASSPPGAVQLERCLFFRNRAASSGGAVWLNTGRRADVLNCSIAENVAGWGGGGFYAAPSTILTISESSLVNNEALTTLGGAVFTVGKLSVAGTVFTNNSAAASGSTTNHLHECSIVGRQQRILCVSSPVIASRSSCCFACAHMHTCAVA
jgi:hypothetical protein